ncbi:MULTISPECIES: hypothetical protein [Vibrio]|uniref:Uncharacterized protein n=1 Tax=Vibrio kanaloae TaxID=170673 RepID=A0ABV4LKD7_9VIBR|nr:hypothetical protein [Vibrio kanaloae]NOI03403.1 hypothetical protein [Vibrio kanaloae]OEF14286.1 hypothetical protein A132_10265 [Vibrio kanaloae 5S-149]
MSSLDNNQTVEKENSTKRDGKGLVERIGDIVIRALFLFILIWSFDGFWHTNVPQLNDFQKHYFPEKYKAEQLKLSTLNENNHYLRNLENATKQQLIDANRKVVEMERHVEKIKHNEDAITQKLSTAYEQFEALCAYTETSELMIKHLTKRYSESELDNTISCTNKECTEILQSKSKVRALCNT